LRWKPQFSFRCHALPSEHMYYSNSSHVGSEKSRLAGKTLSIPKINYLEFH
jgi:hypothetical protein